MPRSHLVPITSKCLRVEAWHPYFLKFPQWFQCAAEFGDCYILCISTPSLNFLKKNFTFIKQKNAGKNWVKTESNHSFTYVHLVNSMNLNTTHFGFKLSLEPNSKNEKVKIFLLKQFLYPNLYCPKDVLLFSKKTITLTYKMFFGARHISTQPKIAFQIPRAKVLIFLRIFENK